LCVLLGRVDGYERAGDLVVNRNVDLTVQDLLLGMR
jgi:hypothetical protein